MDCELLAQQLLRHRVRWAFGVPGGRASLELINDITRSGGRFITTGHETTAALMAGAVSRISKAPSVAITIKGPGVMNLAPGLLSNAYEGYPMLSIAEAYPAHSVDARCHKWLAHGQVLASFAKGYGYWKTDSDLVGRCWAQATAEFPGPMHLEMAEGPGIEFAAREAIPDDTSEVIAQIRFAKRPALIVGSIATRAPWRESLQRLRIPVFTTVSAKGAIPESFAFAAGIYTGAGKSLAPEKVILPVADLVVALGVRSGELLNPDFPNAKCIRLDTPAVRKGGLFPHDAAGGLHYIAAENCAELFETLEPKCWGQEEIAKAFSAMEEALRPWAWSPAQVYRLVTDAEPNAIHVLDTGNFTIIGEHMLRVTTHKDILGTPNGRYMGLGIGYALGAVLASNNGPVVLWIGDGGIRAFLSELSLAVEHKLKLLIVVMSDGFFGSIRPRAAAKGFSTEPLRLGSRDLERIANAMGIDTLVSDGDESLSRGLKAWRASTLPMLIRCDFEPDEYMRMAELLR